MKARQLAIRGGGGGCGMGDYAGGLVSYTISIRVAGRLQSQCIRTALCLFVRARRREHTQREGAVQLDCAAAPNEERQSECRDREEEPARFSEVTEESDIPEFSSDAQMTNRAVSCSPSL